MVMSSRETTGSYRTLYPVDWDKRFLWNILI